MNNEFKVVIGIMRASNLLIDDLKKTLKNYPVNVTEFAVMEFLYSKGDVGCGSGILSIAASYLTDGNIKAVDLDRLAVDVSFENFALNNLEKRIEVDQASLLTKETKKYNIIVANILAHIIELMIDDAYNLLEDGGYYITSGIIEEKKDELLEKMLERGFKFVEETSDNGWYSFVVTK